MISIRTLFSKDNRVVEGNQVSLMHRGIPYIGIVNHCDYKNNKYVVTFTDISYHTRSVCLKRHLIEPVEDVEYEEIVQSCMELNIASMECCEHLELS